MQAISGFRQVSRAAPTSPTRPARSPRPPPIWTRTCRPAPPRGAGRAAAEPGRGRVAAGPAAVRGADLADAGPDHRAARPAGQPADVLPGHPDRRHQRQDVHRADDRRVAGAVGAAGRAGSPRRTCNWSPSGSPSTARPSRPSGTSSSTPTSRRTSTWSTRRRHARTAACRCRSSRSSPPWPMPRSPTSRWTSAVIEVGLGGTWDSTNVADADDRGDHPDRDRPHRLPGRHAHRDRRQQGRHHQGRIRRSP